MRHSVPMVPREAPPRKEVPFNSQMLRSPVTVFCQMRSDLPSPLKSPVPAIDHYVGSVPRIAPPIEPPSLSTAGEIAACSSPELSRVYWLITELTPRNMGGSP